MRMTVPGLVINLIRLIAAKQDWNVKLNADDVS
jgi:hypothetical protein